MFYDCSTFRGGWCYYNYLLWLKLANLNEIITREAYINGGRIWDMTDALHEKGMYDNFLSVGLDLATVDGRIYGVPITNMVAALVWYRTDIFEKYGLQPPATYSDLLQVMDVLKKNNIVPFSLANSNQWTGSMYFMYLVDRIGGPEAFYNAAMRVNGGSFASEVFIKAEKEPLLEKMDFFVFPGMDNGLGSPINLVGTPGDNYFSIAAKSNNKDYALEFLKYLSDDKAADVLLRGGSLPPFGTDVGSRITDPMMQKIHTTFSSADSVQLWYDQFLPPELAGVHLNTTQALFGLEMTPKEAAEKMELEAKRYHCEI